MSNYKEDRPGNSTFSQDLSNLQHKTHDELIAALRTHFAVRYEAKSPTNPKGPLPAEMVQVELSRNAQGGLNIEKQQFYKPLWLAWHVISFDHLGGTWAGSEAHAGINLQRTLEAGTFLITLSKQQSMILEALADFAQVPHQKGTREIQIPRHFINYFNELPQREKNHKQEYQVRLEAERRQRPHK